MRCVKWLVFNTIFQTCQILFIITSLLLVLGSQSHLTIPTFVILSCLLSFIYYKLSLIVLYALPLVSSLGQLPQPGRLFVFLVTCHITEACLLQLRYPSPVPVISVALLHTFLLFLGLVEPLDNCVLNSTLGWDSFPSVTPLACATCTSVAGNEYPILRFLPRRCHQQGPSRRLCFLSLC